MAVSSIKQKPHVLMLATASTGHMAPFKQILCHLAGRSQDGDIIVTVVSNTEHIAAVAKLESQGNFKGLDLRLVPEFGPIPVYKPDPKFPVRGPIIGETNGEEFASYGKELVENKDAPEAPTVIVADMFQYWSKDLADELGVPWYTIFSVSTSMTVCAVNGPTLVKEGMHPYTSSNRAELMTKIPGLSFGPIHSRHRGRGLGF